jgi:hypothetical protein
VKQKKSTVRLMRLIQTAILKAKLMKWAIHGGGKRREMRVSDRELRRKRPQVGGSRGVRVSHANRTNCQYSLAAPYSPTHDLRTSKKMLSQQQP